MHALAAFRRYLEARHAIEHMAVGLLDGDRLLGFSLSEMLPRQYALGHFAKHRIGPRGLYASLMAAAARELLAEGCRYWNWEQDLGIPGLREAKLGFRPTHFLKKYRVWRKTGRNLLDPASGRDQNRGG